jgi:hypothetical protein
LLSLEARNLSRKTIKIYGDAADALIRHLSSCGGPATGTELRREHVEGLLAAMRARGLSASMLSITYRSLKQWTKWLVAEEEIDADPIAGLAAPIVPDIPVPIVPDGDLKKLVAVCAGSDFASRRDAALIRLFLDTGARLSEIADLDVDDLSLGRDANIARVTGKGRRTRDLPFGAKTAQALDRYPGCVAATGSPTRPRRSGWPSAAPPYARPGSTRPSGAEPSRPACRPCTLTSSGTLSPTPVSPLEATRPTSCASRAGRPAPWSAATPPRPPTNAPATPTAASPPATGSRGLPEARGVRLFSRGDPGGYPRQHLGRS